MAALGRSPDAVVVDGRRVRALTCHQVAVVGGDARVASIAAASIVAKVHRDGLMRELDGAHPGYGFARHMGYSTPEHFAALARLGPSPIHRRSFAPVRARAGRTSDAARRDRGRGRPRRVRARLDAARRSGAAPTCCAPTSCTSSAAAARS